MSQNEEKKLRKVNIEDFFTKENEENGVWFEPEINGIPCGIQFLVTGAGTDRNVTNSERFEKKVREIKAKYKDSEEMNAVLRQANAERVADFVSGIKPAEGCEIDFGGKPVEYSRPMMEKIFYNSPMIANEILSFAVRTANFMNRKKD